MPAQCLVVLSGLCQYNEQADGGEIREKERQNSLYDVVRGHSGKGRALRNERMLEICLPPETRLTSGSGLLPSSIFGSITARVTVC